MSEFWQQLSLANISLWMLFSLGMSAPRARNSGRQSDNSTASGFYGTGWACPEDASQTFDPFAETLTVYQHSYFGKEGSYHLNGTLFSPVFGDHEVVNRKQEIIHHLHRLIKDLAWRLSAAGGRQPRMDWQPATKELRDLEGAEGLLVSTIEEMASFSVSRSGHVQPDDQVARFAAYVLGNVHPTSNDSHADRRRRSDLRPSSRNGCVGLRGSLNCMRLATALSTLHESFVTFSERAGKGQFGNVLTTISTTVTGFPSEKWVVEAFASYLTLLQVGGYAALHFALHVHNRTEEARQVTCVKNTRFQRQHAIFVSALQNASEVSKVSHIRREYEPYSEWQLGAGVEQGDVHESQRNQLSVSALTGCQLYTAASRLALRCSFSKAHAGADPALWAFEAGPANWRTVAEGASSKNISKKRRINRVSCQWQEVTQKGQALCGLALVVTDKLLDLKIKVCNMRNPRFKKWGPVSNPNCTETLKKRRVEVDTRPVVTDLPGWVTGVRLYRNSQGRLALEMKRRFQLSETEAVE